MADQKINKVPKTKIMTKSSKTELHQEIDFISMLNNDCLINILQYLSVKEKIQAERVSKRFNELSKLSWSNVKECTLKTESVYSSYNHFNDERIPIVRTNQILERCGIYLENVGISCSNKPSANESNEFQCVFCSNVIKKLIDTTAQIKCLKLYSSLHNIIDNDVRLLFLKNQSLNSLTLSGSINGECFSALPFLKIKELKLNSNIQLKTEYIQKYFPLLKNLEKVDLNYNYEVRQKIQDELIAALSVDCHNIQELNISIRNELSPIQKLSILISQNKNLQKLFLKDGCIESNILKALGNCMIKHLKLYECTMKASDFLNHFPKCNKLEILEIENNDDEILEDSLLTSFTLCDNLKTLRIDNNSDLLSFKKFLYLETLQLFTIDITDACLTDIAKCKQLKYLALSPFETTENSFGDKGLSEIRTLPNLIDLFVMVCNVTDESLSEFTKLEKLAAKMCDKVKAKGLCTLIKNSRNLEILDVASMDESIAREIVEFAIDIKNINYRNRHKVLLILVCWDDFDLSTEFQNTSPYVKVEYDHDYGKNYRN